MTSVVQEEQTSRQFASCSPPAPTPRPHTHRLTMIGHTRALFPKLYSGSIAPRISTCDAGSFSSSSVSRSAVWITFSSPWCQPLLFSHVALSSQVREDTPLRLFHRGNWDQRMTSDNRMGRAGCGAQKRLQQSRGGRCHHLEPVDSSVCCLSSATPTITSSGQVADSPSSGFTASFPSLDHSAPSSRLSTLVNPSPPALPTVLPSPGIARSPRSPLDSPSFTSVHPQPCRPHLHKHSRHAADIRQRDKHRGVPRRPLVELGRVGWELAVRCSGRGEEGRADRGEVSARERRWGRDQVFGRRRADNIDRRAGWVRRVCRGR